jgi:hypothetical protein
MVKIAIFLATIFLLHCSAYGQTLHASVDKSNILIGDQITLRIELKSSEDANVKWPALSDLPKGLEIVSAPTQKREKENVTMSVVLTAFEKGTYVIPPLTVQFSKEKKLSTQQISIEVRTIQVDTSKEIKDVKPPLEIPFRFRDAVPYILGTVAAGLLAWGIFYVIKKRKKLEKILPAPPSRPAHEIALEELRKLETERLWQNGRIKDYHSQLTDILRTYIERKYFISAMEMTSEAILSTATITLLPEAQKKQIEEILTLADLVKFAKFLPDPAQQESVLQFAISFVEATSHEQKMEIAG